MKMVELLPLKNCPLNNELTPVEKGGNNENGVASPENLTILMRSLINTLESRQYRFMP